MLARALGHGREGECPCGLCVWQGADLQTPPGPKLCLLYPLTEGSFFQQTLPGPLLHSRLVSRCWRQEVRGTRLLSGGYISGERPQMRTSRRGKSHEQHRPRATRTKDPHPRTGAEQTLREVTFARILPGGEVRALWGLGEEGPRKRESTGRAS